jgi:hypothetical protein
LLLVDLLLMLMYLQIKSHSLVDADFHGLNKECPGQYSISLVVPKQEIYLAIVQIFQVIDSSAFGNQLIYLPSVSPSVAAVSSAIKVNF